jgi:spermidine synthase
LALLVLFFFSGVSGLVFEVVWIRLLTTVLGNTVFAVSTVLTAFMAGLALGSYLGGRRIDRGQDPLLTYGCLEIGVGLTALGLTVVLDQTGPLSVWLHQAMAGYPVLLFVSRYAFCFALMFAPTTLMGATLPVLCKYVVGSEDLVGLNTGRLYALNTLGAALGCFLAGFFLIGSIGLRRTAISAVAVSAAVGCLALLLRSRTGAAPGPEVDAPEVSPGRSRPPLRWLVLGAFALSGFASLGYEVVWTRVLTRFLGNSVYAFSAMLTTFLVGLALGSLVLSPFVDRIKRRIAVLGAVEFGVALYVLLSIGVYSWQLENLLPFAHPFPAWDAPLWRFLCTFSVLLVPTFLMGATFPLAARAYVADMACLGRNVGVLYGWNTVGAILGAAVTGFVILPLLGMADAMLVLVWLNFSIGAALFLVEPRIKPPRRVAPVIVLLLVGLAVSVSLPRDVFRRAHRLSVPESRLLRFEEGVLGTVTVDEDAGHLFMRMDGLDLAGTGLMYESSARALGHLPMLLHPNPEAVFVLGFGGGATTYAVSTYPGVRRIDGAELSAAVLGAAPLFEKINHSVLDDPRVDIEVTDGRHALLTAERSYDVITVDLLWPQTAGTGSMYTQEFYEICHERLGEDGVMVEWLHPGFIPPEYVKTIIRTMRSVFPHVSLWTTRRTYHLVLAGSKAPLAVDYGRFAERLAHPATRYDLAQVGIRDAANMASYFIAHDEVLERFVAGSDTVNTDDLPIVEYGLPHFKRSAVLDNRRELAKLYTPATAVFSGLDDQEKRTLEAYWKATRIVNEWAILMENGDRAAAGEKIRPALMIAPGHLESREAYRVSLASQRAAGP